MASRRGTIGDTTYLPMGKLTQLRRLALVFFLLLPDSSSMTIRITAPPEFAGRTLLNLQVPSRWHCNVDAIAMDALRAGRVRSFAA